MSEIDLNLLRVFDTLFELRNVTRTGARLGLTQSAVSHALGRLRQSIGDPLFVRAPGGLQPTARAVEIAPGIREGLVQLRGALSPSDFDPALATRRFRIAAGSYFCALLIPALITHVRRMAPKLSFQIIPLGSDLLSALDEGGVDIALGAFTKVPSRLTYQHLYREDLVWIAAADNPIASAPLDRARIAAQPRALVSTGKPFDALRAFASEGGLERRVIVEADDADDTLAGEEPAVVYDALTAMAIVGKTDCVAMVPRRLARQDAARHGVTILDDPAEHSGIDLAMLWHNKFDGDAGIVWLRDRIAEAAG